MKTSAHLQAVCSSEYHCILLLLSRQSLYCVIIDQINKLPEDELKSSPKTSCYIENEWISRKKIKISCASYTLLVYIDSKNRLQTTLYKKPTDCQNYLHAKSAHPFSLKKGIPYSQALRIKRICSTFEEYRKHSQDLIKRFVEKGYNELTVRKQIERVDHLDRSLPLKNFKPTRKDSISFSVTYDPVLPNIQEIINKHWHILNIDSSFKDIFNSSQLMIAFHKNTSLKQLIGTNTVKNNQKVLSPTQIATAGQCTPCYTSQLICCQQVLKTTTFSSTQTKETFKIFHQVTCYSNCVIYLL